MGSSPTTEDTMDSSTAATALSAASSSPVAPVVAAPAPAPLPFDWYSNPLFYDIIFEEDTVYECNMLRAIAKRFAPPGSLLNQIVLATPEQDGKEGTSKPTAASSSVVPSPASSGVIRVLEPACGSARLMLAMLDAGRRLDPPGLRWSTVGFDLSRGAVEFARKRWNEAQETTAQGKQMLNNPQLSNDASSSVAAPSPSTADASSPFTVFEADMTNFSAALAQHDPCAAAAAAAPSSSSAVAASAPAAGFDVAHCLVSSIKHLLDPAEVQRHFEQVADSLAPEGIYIVALHIHTLEGRSHFDRAVNYSAAGATTTASVAAVDVATDSSATAALPPSSSSPAADDAAESEDEEVDDEFTGDYSRGSTQFTAELITYAPDPATMLEKMIARVSTKDDTHSSPASSPPPLQTDMSLRVYTLSSLHSLLCGLSRRFHLSGCYNYSDIYDDEWSARDQCQLMWPFPLPSEDQIKSTASASSQSKQAAASSATAVPAASASASLPAARNWNRVYRVPRAIMAQWRGVEAIVLVLRKADDPACEAAQQRWIRECTIHRARLARILDREAAETAQLANAPGSASSADPPAASEEDD